MSKRRGFTLVELLVVIAIIALLMAILMPALSRAKQQAKAVICQTALRQWGLVFQMYQDDYGQFMVYSEPEWITSKVGGCQWVYTMYPYFKNMEISLCPAAKKHTSETIGSSFMINGDSDSTWYVNFGGVPGWPDSEKDVFGSFGINCWLSDVNPVLEGMWDYVFHGFPKKERWISLDNIKGANNVPMLLDSGWHGGNPKETDLPPEYEDVFIDHIGCMERHVIDRHRGGTINGIFADQHVRKIDLKELWRLKWHRSCDTTGGPVGREWPEWMRNFKDYDILPPGAR